MDATTTGRQPFDSALAWIAALPAAARIEASPPLAAAGRVLALPVTAPRDHPETDRAVLTGYALRASETVGADGYNRLTPSRFIAVAAGESLPADTDAVLSRHAAEPGPNGQLQVTAPLTAGEGVERAGAWVRRGEQMLAVTGRPLRPEDIGLLTELSIPRVSVFTRPRVRLTLPDGVTPTLAALLHSLLLRERTVPTLTAEIDLALIAGNDAPSALTAAGGRLDISGLALRPGGATGLGWLNGVPVVTLPGEPLACLTAFDLLVVPLIRRLSGPTALCEGVSLSSSAVVTVPAARKFVSQIGSVDVIRVRLIDGRAEPLGPAEGSTLATATAADGFVLIPAPREGYGPGCPVDVYLTNGLDIASATGGTFCGFAPSRPQTNGTQRHD